MDKCKLIAFTGVASSGKTTLMNTVSNILENNGYTVKKDTNVSRDTIKEFGIHLNDILKDYDLTVEFQSRILQKFQDRHKIDNKYDFIICDRSIYCGIIYTILNTNKRLYYKVLNNIEIPNYDMLFYVEPLDFKSDGIRLKQYRENGELELYKLFVEPNCDYTIYTDSIKNRVKHVIDFIDNILLVDKLF